MFPYVPPGRSVAASGRTATQAVLLAAAALGREEQPELYRHIYPHGRATAIMARSFAEAFLPRGRGPTLEEIELGAHLHDFGKYLIPELVLLKPGPLSEEERAPVTLHPVYGARSGALPPRVLKRGLTS